jgi:predicted SnoaL-like aldol condensation-catalyzing enzyme
VTADAATATATATADWIVECMGNADLAGLARRYADNVLLDVSSPKWRAQLQGRAAATESLAEDAAKLPNVRTAWSRATVGADAVVVEYEMRWDAPDGEALSRAVSIFRLDGEQIVEHRDYCCGAWTPADIAKNIAEAPIIRW